MGERYQTVLLFGAPGAGKGTQGKIIGAVPGFFHLSVGEVFRSLDVRSELGKTFVEYSSRGELVPDELTVQMWAENMHAQTVLSRYKPYDDLLILDGIPRNVNQARLLQTWLDVRAVIHLVISDKNEIMERMSRRALKENRADDARDDVIRKRIAVYESETFPILEFYPREVVHEVDAIGSPGTILRQIMSHLVPVQDQRFEAAESARLAAIERRPKATGERGPLPRDARIFVAGHKGLVGSAVCRKLAAEGFINVVTRSRDELDLRDPAAVDRFFTEARPEYVVLAAAKVGGIMANATYPADFIADNIAIASAVIPAAHKHGVQKLLNLGSSCIYPSLAKQPLKEEYLLTGPLEETNRAYAVAKIAAIELCDSFRKQHGCDFISAMPTNLYGPGDNFNLETSHVVPALIRRFIEAKDAGTPSVTLWGTGSPRREFLYVDDLADACLFLLENVSRPGPINIGTGSDITVQQLAELIASRVGYTGRVGWDTSKPDGTPRKLLEVSRMTSLGWTASTSLESGIDQTIEWYRANPPA